MKHLKREMNRRPDVSLPQKDVFSPLQTNAWERGNYFLSPYILNQRSGLIIGRVYRVAG